MHDLPQDLANELENVRTTSARWLRSQLLDEIVQDAWQYLLTGKTKNPVFVALVLDDDPREAIHRFLHNMLHAGSPRFAALGTSQSRKAVENRAHSLTIKMQGWMAHMKPYLPANAFEEGYRGLQAIAEDLAKTRNDEHA